ncbi:MAG: nitronate monooxygenase [Proteobacteria bacterium]|nr:nitronate monooxygenase [Pseudomonadota bacterium]
MRFDNDLTRMLGVQYPIIQGAIGWRGSGGSEIAVPVSEAGGLGILTTISYKDPEAFQQDIRTAKAKTDKPFAVNFTLMKDTKFTDDYHKEYVRITLEEGIKTVFTSAYDGSYIGKTCKDAGCNWIHKCATIKHAVSVAEKGADAVVIVGREGTGYKNPEQNTTLINMTVARRLISVPLIAAGGIGDARGFIAALAMGASGIYMGTAFMATNEFKSKQGVKDRIVDQDVGDPEYNRKILQMKHGATHSFASGVIDSVQSVQDLIHHMMIEAEGIMTDFKTWGMLAND